MRRRGSRNRAPLRSKNPATYYKGAAPVCEEVDCDYLADIIKRHRLANKKNPQSYYDIAERMFNQLRVRSEDRAEVKKRLAYYLEGPDRKGKA